MKKIKVRLKAEIARRRDGFYDLSEGQKIAPTSDKPEKEVFEVLETPFIVSKIRSGELIKVGEDKADTESAGANESGSDDDDDNLNDSSGADGSSDDADKAKGE